MAEYHNVSVRLNEDDYKKLLFLNEKYNRMSMAKITLADILRTGIKELYYHETSGQELNTTKPVNTAITVNTVKEVKQEDKQEDKTDNKQVQNTPASLERDITIDDILKEYEQELRQDTNSKGKPYSESYIRNKLNEKRKQLENATKAVGE